MRSYVVGVDLGQSVDYTALAVVERAVEHAPDFTRSNKPIARPARYAVRHLERLPLGCSYVQQAEAVGRLMARPELGGARLVIDETGVGKAVFDIFVAAGLRPSAVVITGGQEVGSGSDGAQHVPKVQLISLLQAKLHDGSLKISRHLPEAATLARELAEFRVNFTAAGGMQFGARTGRHDDLVLSLAIALWHARSAGASYTTAPILIGGHR